MGVLAVMITLGHRWLLAPGLLCSISFCTLFVLLTEGPTQDVIRPIVMQSPAWPCCLDFLATRIVSKQTSSSLWSIQPWAFCYRNIKWSMTLFFQSVTVQTRTTEVVVLCVYRELVTVIYLVLGANLLELSAFFTIHFIFEKFQKLFIFSGENSEKRDQQEWITHDLDPEIAITFLLVFLAFKTESKYILFNSLLVFQLECWKCCTQDIGEEGNI